MKKVRSYTSIWSVEKVLYAINDLQLPFPITFTQMTWFIVSLFAVMLLGDLPPLSSIDGAFLKYVGIPAGLTWSITPKLTYAGKPVKSQKEKQTAAVTYVWRYHNEISD